MSYEEIMARVPKVTWTPLPSPTHVDLANQDPYLDAKLRCAARVIWLDTRWRYEWYSGCREDLEPSPHWLDEQTDLLRRMLQGGVPPIRSEREELRWYVLRLLGIVQSYASSSAYVERREPEAVADFDPVASGGA